MAWEEVTCRGIKGISGDKPIDEFALALRRIATHYADAFSRLPTLYEVICSLDSVIRPFPHRYVSGEYFNLCESSDNLISKTLTEHLHFTELDLPCFEASFCDNPPPGYYVIERNVVGDGSTRDVLHVKRLNVVERSLFCEYHILDRQYTEEAARFLIRRVLLDRFCDHHYDMLADNILFCSVEPFRPMQ
jgi:hypothetical protein